MAEIKNMICAWLDISRKEREKNNTRVISYEERGCYECDGSNKTCKAYNPIRNSAPISR